MSRPTSIGFIGLGPVGLPMASNIASAGFDLMVYDEREAPLRELAALGANVAATPRAVGEHSEIILLWPDDDAGVEAAVLGDDGVLSGARPGAVIAIHSAVRRDTVHRVAEAASAHGVGVIDAQTTSGADGARARTITYLVGGDAQLLERCRPVFAVSGTDIHHMGELGMGVIAKCVQQAITCGTILAVSEGMRLATAGGLDVHRLPEVLRTSGAYSRVLEDWLGSFAEMAPSRGRVYHKALRPAVALGHDLNVPLPVAVLAQQLIPQVPWRETGE